MAKCKSCGAEIIWAVSRSGKACPISAAEYPNGNVVLVPNSDPREPPFAMMVRRDQHPELIRRISHFADCPTADQHRPKQ